MFHFKDPSDFASIVPPVPDVKAWLQEFRSKHPYPKTNGDEQYQQEISSLNTRNETLRMEFETMEISNKTITTDHNSLTNEHSLLNNEHEALKKEYLSLELKHNQLKCECESQLDQIAYLKKQMHELQDTNTNLLLHSNNHSNNKENTNNMNQLQWNFDLNSKPQKSTETNNNRKENRKRPRSDISATSDAIEQKTNFKKPKLTLSQSSKSKSLSVDPNSILEKKLPTNLDLIRGDILAEAGSVDQIQYCFNMLKKCTTDEWQLRNFLMSMIAGLVDEKGYIPHNIVYDARHTIKKQLTDLRSAIVKTTCEMLISFSKYCDQSKYGQCLAYFIPMHLQGLYVTISCIRDAHDVCLSKSINNTRSFKCITPLLKGLTNKHSEVRVKVILLLSSLIISTYSDNSVNNKKMEKYADAIGNTIKTYVSDANFKVRDAVKVLFENFAKQFPNRSKSLLARMDLNSQKTLRKCIVSKDKSTKTKYKKTSSNYGQPSRTLRKR